MCDKPNATNRVRDKPKYMATMRLSACINQIVGTPSFEAVVVNEIRQILVCWDIPDSHLMGFIF